MLRAYDVNLRFKRSVIVESDQTMDYVTSTAKPRNLPSDWNVSTALTGVW